MRPDAPSVLPTALSPNRTIRYADWQGVVQRASDLDQLIAIVRAYLAEWRPEELEALPLELCTASIRSSEEIATRAVMATQLELKLAHDDPGAVLLREMSLTLMAAASRLRFLTAMRTREGRR